MTRVIFMCGPSGAGKTTYARRLEGAGMVRLSFDGHLWARGIRSGEVPAIVRDEVRALAAEHGTTPETGFIEDDDE